MFGAVQSCYSKLVIKINGYFFACYSENKPTQRKNIFRLLADFCLYFNTLLNKTLVICKNISKQLDAAGKQLNNFKVARVHELIRENQTMSINDFRVFFSS
jgi:hypothetical protein